MIHITAKFCITAALKEYHRCNSALPEKIVFYRDGVGEGQLAAVVDHEIKQLLETLKAVGQQYE